MLICRVPLLMAVVSCCRARSLCFGIEHGLVVLFCSALQPWLSFS